jgi:Domain of unknown function (DUF1929)
MSPQSYIPQYDIKTSSKFILKGTVTVLLLLPMLFASSYLQFDLVVPYNTVESIDTETPSYTEPSSQQQIAFTPNSIPLPTTKPKDSGVLYNLQSTPVEAVHVAQLPSGEVLMHNGKLECVAGQECGIKTYKYNPYTATSTTIFANKNLFCVGGIFGTDGNLYYFGGHVERTPNNLGLEAIGKNYAQKYNVTSGTPDTWTSQTPIQKGRWYPTAIVGPDGKIGIFGGHGETESVLQQTPEIFDPATQVSTLKPGATKIVDAAKENYSIYYPHLFYAPTGDIINTGPDPFVQVYNLSGNGSFQFASTNANGLPTVDFRGVPYQTDGTVKADYAAALKLPNYNGDQSILQFGGGLPAGPWTISYNPNYVTATNKYVPHIWENAIGDPVLGIVENKRHPQAVVGPDLVVYVAGGSNAQDITDQTGFKDDNNQSNGIYTFLLNYSKWKKLSSTTLPMEYHGTATLMRSGHILYTNGEWAYNTKSTDPTKVNPTWQYKQDGTKPFAENAQIYAPPYLYDDQGNLAPRLEIDISKKYIANLQPTYVGGLGGVFSIDMKPGDNTKVRYATMVRNVFTTHSVTMGQANLRVWSWPEAGNKLGLQVETPNPYIAVPGSYWLYVMDDKGVPSIAAEVKIVNGTTQTASLLQIQLASELRQLLTVAQKQA